jgi:HlyD family secretion protein
VIRIADRAEFTPRNVQTQEGRRTTVFAVEISVSDPGGWLKPGMPADVLFPEQ